MDGKKKRRKRGKQGRSEGVCVQVWDTVRWITQPNGQFITVRRGRKERAVRKGKRERGRLRYKEDED